ncbi:MAG: hypothetical protein ACYC3H_01305 [Bellilinea sp.]
MNSRRISGDACYVEKPMPAAVAPAPGAARICGAEPRLAGTTTFVVAEKFMEVSDG